MQNLSTVDLACVVRFIYYQVRFIHYQGRYFQIFYKFFKKKRYLRDISKTDEDPKKIRDAISASFADEGDVFNEGMHLSGCTEILFNCLKNFEAKVMELYEPGNENKNMYIQGKKQLVDLEESIRFMTSKFDEL